VPWDFNCVGGRGKNSPEHLGIELRKAFRDRWIGSRKALRSSIAVILSTKYGSRNFLRRITAAPLHVGPRRIRQDSARREAIS